MRFFGVAVAVVATFSSYSAVQAQSIASVGGPRELPPASYTGQQYVDSRGCVFLKAGYAGQTNWVPRVNARREALCGFPPTFAPVSIEIAEQTPAPAPSPAAPTPRVVAQVPTAPAPASPPRTAVIDPATYAPAPYTPPVRAAAPAPSVAPPVTTARIAPTAPYTAAAPSRTFEVAASGPGPGQIGCFTSAPVAEVVRLRSGGTAVVCTKGDGSLSGWRAPIYPAGSPVGVALTDPVLQAPVARAKTDPVGVAAATAMQGTARVVAQTVPTPPKGYKLAWTDDRLNPSRGQGTASGQAAQDQIWTRDVPAKLVAEQPRKKVRVTVSSKSEPAPPAPKGQGKALVQVGTFGQPSNADGAAARLAALGLPVAKSRTTKGGKTLQIVFAGPFASAAEAQAALTAARRAGFSDAFLR